MNDQGFLLLSCTPYCRREMDDHVLTFSTEQYKLQFRKQKEI